MLTHLVALVDNDKEQVEARHDGRREGNVGLQRYYKVVFYA